MIKKQPRRMSLAAIPLAAWALLALACATAAGQAPMNGQAGMTNGLYGRPTAQPYFDFPNWARFSNCRPGPLPWGYEVYPDYGPCDCAANGNVPYVGCERDFVVHRPSSWYASADFVPLTFDYGGDIDLAAPLVAGAFDPAVLTTEDLLPEFNAGGKFTVGRRVFDCFRIEGTYLGNYDWQSSAIARTAAANLSTILSDFVIPANAIFDNNTEVFAAQGSRMYSGEVNARYWLDMPPGPFDVSCLVGARYMRVDDAFRLHTTNAAGDNDVLSAAENSMWGVQAGIAGDFMFHPRFWLNVDLKGGIYDNNTSIFYTLDSFNNAQDIPPVTGSAHRTAFVGDLSVVGHWQITPTLVFNLGYQAVFVDGVALGFENAANPPFQDGINVPPTTQFNDSGSLAYHGPVIGLLWQR